MIDLPAVLFKHVPTSVKRNLAYDAITLKHDIEHAVVEGYMYCIM